MVSCFKDDKLFYPIPNCDNRFPFEIDVKFVGANAYSEKNELCCHIAKSYCRDGVNSFFPVQIQFQFLLFSENSIPIQLEFIFILRKSFPIRFQFQELELELNEIPIQLAIDYIPVILTYKAWLQKSKKPLFTIARGYLHKLFNDKSMFSDTRTKILAILLQNDPRKTISVDIC